jgi:ABC-type lipoprotein export system ATPase subunit
VAICRALINHSDLILADEPTGNLDSASSETVMEYLQMINKDMKKTVVLVTHDAYVASLIFLSLSYELIALISPIVPIDIKSSTPTPVLSNFFAI